MTARMTSPRLLPSTICWPFQSWTIRTACTVSSPPMMLSTRSYPRPGRNACPAYTTEHKGETNMTVSHRLRPLRVRLLVLLAVVGPGIITANVDNDAGGITTYSVAGAHYGVSLLWIMPLVGLALIIIQEMSARLGIVTGRGL